MFKVFNELDSSWGNNIKDYIKNAQQTSSVVGKRNTLLVSVSYVLQLIDFN